MKLSDEFILREIAGEYMLVPVGAAAARLNGLVAVNEIGSFIMKTMETAPTAEALVEKITSEYDIDAETAARDLQDFLQQLRELGALIED